MGTALSGGVRLALANTDRPRLSVLNTCGDSRPVVRWEKLPAISAVFASSFLALAGNWAVAGSLIAVGLGVARGLTVVARRIIEGFHDPALGDIVLAIETAGVGA